MVWIINTRNMNDTYHIVSHRLFFFFFFSVNMSSRQQVGADITFLTHICIIGWTL